MPLLLFGRTLLLTVAFLSVGAAPVHLLHRSRSGDGLRLPAARVRDQGARVRRVFDTYTWLGEPAGKAAVCLAAAIAVTPKCTPPVRRALRAVTEPDMAWAFRDSRGEERPADPPDPMSTRVLDRPAPARESGTRCRDPRRVECAA